MNVDLRLFRSLCRSDFIRSSINLLNSRFVYDILFELLWFVYETSTNLEFDEFIEAIIRSLAFIRVRLTFICPLLSGDFPAMLFSKPLGMHRIMRIHARSPSSGCFRLSLIWGLTQRVRCTETNVFELRSNDVRFCVLLLCLSSNHEYLPHSRLTSLKH